MDNNGESFTINSLSRKLKINYRIAYEDIKELEKEKLIMVKKAGNSSLCNFSFNFNEKVYLIESQKKQQLLADSNIQILSNKIERLKLNFYICLVFGSYAGGENKKGSDIDICVITDNEETRKQISQTIQLTSFNIHYLDFISKDFISMLKTTEINVGKEILKRNVILKGIEEFYGLISNAR
jgi:predicted nucleotidyltransferase